MQESALNSIIRNKYSFLSLKERVFIALRMNRTPYAEMASLLPSTGRVLDIGCGHGLLSLYLGLQSPSRVVSGIEHDTHRVECARRAAAETKNVSFEVKDLNTLDAQNKFNGIACIDVLHYLNESLQKSILKRCHDLLESGGVLIFREIDPNKGMLSHINRLYEKIAIATKFTQASEIHTHTVNEWVAMAEKAGFRVSSRPLTRFPFADQIFICQKSV